MLVGLKNAIGQSGYDLLMFASEHPGNGYGKHSYLKRARHHNVEGVVLMGIDPEEPEVRRLVRSDLPAVGVDVASEGPATSFVISTTRTAHPAPCGTSTASATAASPRSRGCSRRGRAPSACAATARLRASGLAYRDEYVAYKDFYAESGRRAMADLLALDEPPTAVFAASDMMALGAIRAAGRRRRERPDRRLRYRLRRHAARGT